jgi:hypothetical protein
VDIELITVSTYAENPEIGHIRYSSQYTKIPVTNIISEMYYQYVYTSTTQTVGLKEKFGKKFQEYFYVSQSR